MRLVLLCVALLLVERGSQAAYTIAQCTPGCFCIDAYTADCECGAELLGIPQTLPIDLRRLTVKHCPIRRLQPDQFSRYRQLQQLTLTGHNIETIEEFTFRGLNQLKSLIISNNTALRRLTAGSLGGIHSDGQLKIYLHDNNISDIDGYVFSDTRGIYEIVFGLNSTIRNIRKHAFSGLYHVRYLRLPLNLEVIEEQAFDNFTRLHHLQIQKWHAVRHGGIASKTFAGLRHVKSISVVKSRLGTIHEHAFSGVHVVQQIDISDCRISRIRKRAFVGVRSVGLITFRHNTINRLDRNFFAFISLASEDRDGGGVRFEHNRLNCSCRNMWLFEPDYAASLPNRLLEDNTCSGPPDFKDRRLADLPATWLARCRLRHYDEATGAVVTTAPVGRTWLLLLLLAGLASTVSW